MALTSQMQTLRIDYDPALVPAGGAEVTRACASPVSGEGRMTAEPAGRGFHEKVMRVTGLITGAFAVRPLGPEAELRRFEQAVQLVNSVVVYNAVYPRSPQGVVELLQRLDRSA